MRVVLLTCVYPPEPVTSASTSHSLAVSLAERGHDVMVVTSYPNRPSGRLFSGYRRRFVGYEDSGRQVRVIRCFSTISSTGTVFSRLSENLSFGFLGGLILACLRRPDVIYVNTWPVFASGMAALIARLRHVPMVLSIQDVYPESLVSLGKLNANSWVEHLLRRVDAWVARKSAAVVVISRRVEEIYLQERGIRKDRIHKIPNWREVEDVPSAEMSLKKRKNWGVGNDVFLIVFAGNVAAACGIESVIHAVSELQNVSLKLVVAGAGSALASCQNITERYKERRVKFCGPFVAEETMAILGAADILILPTQGDQSLVSMPSKLISYMMAGRPLLAIARAESDLAAVVNEAGCGWVVEPGDAEQLRHQLRVIATLDSSELTRMGALGRKYALDHFSTEACLPNLVATIEDIERKK